MKEEAQGMNPKAMKGISFYEIRRIAVIYMTLPLILFFCGFLRWYYAVLCCLVLIPVLGKTLRDTAPLKQEFSSCYYYSWKTIFLVFLFSLLWTYLGGLNGYYAQSSDWDCRNAIYFDLIQYRWPVMYAKNGGALVYYLGHWLPPAAVAKLAFKITDSIELARQVGRFGLWLWSASGISIVMLMVFRVVEARTRGKRIAAAFFFVFFSGLDLIGAIQRGRLELLLEPSRLHLEWWYPGFQYTSIMACLFWVFNQAIIPWLITLCFFTEKNPKNYVYYCVICLLCGTLPCVGLTIMMLASALLGIVKSLKRKSMKPYIKDTLSLQNLLSFFILFPVIAAFMLSANTANALKLKGEQRTEAVPFQNNELSVSNLEQLLLGIRSASAEEDTGSGQQDLSAEEKTPYEGIFSAKYINRKLVEFLLLEVGLYMVLIGVEHRRNPMYWFLWVFFFFVPYFHVGESHDFCMRVSIPGIFILMLYVNRFLLDYFPVRSNSGKRKSLQVLAVLLAICFAIGAATPLMEIYRGAYQVVTKGTIFLENQKIMSFNQEHIYNNFLCSNPDEHFFFQHLAR